ncbi:MAG: hypothetical protein ACQ9MH_14235 [Nitrospinales bacterium]
MISFIRKLQTKTFPKKYYYWLLVPSVICMLSFVIFIRSQQSIEQKELIRTLVYLKHKDIKTIKYLAGHELGRKTACYKFSDASDIKEMVAWLGTADDKGPGGHVTVIREERLVLIDQNNVESVYLLSIFDNANPDDAFLNEGPWVREPNGRTLSLPKGDIQVRVPGFGKWLFNKIDSNIMVNC